MLSMDANCLANDRMMSVRNCKLCLCCMLNGYNSIKRISIEDALCMDVHVHADAASVYATILSQTYIRVERYLLRVMKFCMI